MPRVADGDVTAGSAATSTQAPLELPAVALRQPSNGILRGSASVGTWQRICFGEWAGKRRDLLFEQVKNRPVGCVPKWLPQFFELIPGSVREAAVM